MNQPQTPQPTAAAAKHPLPKPAIAILWVIAGLYGAFLLLDLFWPSLWLCSGVLKYTGMLLCLLLSGLSLRRPLCKHDARLLFVALCFTCVADVFLLFTAWYAAGIAVFCGAHLTYLRRYRPKVFVPFATVSVLVLLAALVLSVLPATRNAGPVLSSLLPGALYAVLFLSVTAFAFRAPYPAPNRRLIRAGMVLFLLCDVNVALFNLLPWSAGLHTVTGFFMWFFYLPAQTLLALSAYRFGAAKAA